MRLTFEPCPQPQSTMNREHNRARRRRGSCASFSLYDREYGSCRTRFTGLSLVSSAAPAPLARSCLSSRLPSDASGNGRNSASRLISTHGFQSLITASGSMAGNPLAPGRDNNTSTGVELVMVLSVLLSAVIPTELVEWAEGVEHRTRTESPTDCKTCTTRARKSSRLLEFLLNLAV